MSGTRAEQPVLVLTQRALAVRSSLEPTAWIVLEELAVRAEHIDGQVVAEQSARTLAESVGRSKDAVARALRQLSDAGLIERGESRHGFSGRFTGGHYIVDLRVAGLRLPTVPVAPTTAPRAAAPPRPDLAPPPAPRERFVGPDDAHSTPLI
ncbi:MAG: MarR family transcriptional regulator [Acidimicrobiia bacterium]|nr:MarR family transcriptional regulator [Acidimicrobiia bacterium]